MKIHAITSAVAAIMSFIGSLMANLAARESLLVIVLAVLFVQWHAQRRRQIKTQQQQALVATMRSLSEEATFLSCSEIAARHPELRCEVHIFERTVVRCLADVHRGRAAVRDLSLIQRYVIEIAPQLLAAVQTYDDKVTLQGACRQFRLMSQKLLARSDNGVQAPDTQFAFNGRTSNRPGAAMASR
jgi:hypothetical protein